jgi:hypothetical protein
MKTIVFHSCEVFVNIAAVDRSSYLGELTGGFPYIFCIPVRRVENIVR